MSVTKNTGSNLKANSDSAFSATGSQAKAQNRLSEANRGRFKSSQAKAQNRLSQIHTFSEPRRRDGANG